ncbi:MAG TPA: tetratricopeptide repeat protein [Bryobacteraceae bacterium]
MMRGFIRLLIILLVLAGAVVAGITIWRNSRPREITVAIYSDLTFRQRPDWRETLQSRFDAVTKMYDQAAHVRWKVVADDLTDPTALLRTLEARRVALKQRPQAQKADLLVLYTGLAEGGRTASANAFSHVMALADLRREPESENVLVLAHELAHLFGAPHEDKSAKNLMSEPPANGQFPDRTVKVIRKMRDYNFAAGTDVLEGKQRERALAAVTEANSGLQRNPAAQAHEVIAQALQADGHNGRAIPDFREAARLDPNNAAFHMALAAALAQDLYNDEAMKELREAVRLDPNNARYRVTLSAYLTKNGDAELATDELRAAIKLAPNDATLYSALGSILATQAGRIDAAVEAFETALKLNPQLAGAQMNMTRLTAFKQQAQAEAARVRNRVQQNPQNPVGHMALGAVEMRLGDLQAAQKEFDRALELNPNLPQAHSNLGEIHYLREDYAAAWQEVKKARAAGGEPRQALVHALQRKAPQQP